MGQVVSQFIADYGELLVEGVRDTIIMTAVATLLAYVIGLPVGVLLITSAKKGIRPNAPLNTVLGWIVNIVRSVPFIILLVAIIPLTRLIVGTSLGVPGAIVPLVITAAPFVARVVEQSLAEVDGSLVEAAQSFGASNLQIVFKVLLFESLPSLVRGAALTFITLFGFSAMAGTVGAGGLGDIAIRYGYQRYQGDVMWITVVLLVIIVANLVHVHALWNGITVYPQAGKKHGMPQNRHILKLLCHGIYPHRASPLSFGFLWELSSMKSPFGSVSRSFRNAREIVLPFRSRYRTTHSGSP